MLQGSVPGVAPSSAVDALESAVEAGCRYVDDRSPGIRRIRHGKGFSYVTAAGEPVRDPKVLERIASLVIPPAWENVWICPSANGHVQATGRDARGRKQYRYHPRFREVRDATKYDRLHEFATALPKIRSAVDRHLRQSGPTREKVLATVVRLLESTLIRVGNEEYARTNESFGLTTLRTRHVDIGDSAIAFKFRGKSGKEHTVTVRDRRLARILQRFHDLPGETLFQWVDGSGILHAVEASDVNDYLRTVSGTDFTAKHFRTWAGTVHTAVELLPLPPFRSPTEAKRNVTGVLKNVAGRLGNTVSVCRKSYVHPAILRSYEQGDLPKNVRVRASKAKRARTLSSEERAVANYLRRVGASSEPPRKRRSP